MRKNRSVIVALVVSFVAIIAIAGAVTYSNSKGNDKDKITKAEEEDSRVTQGEQIQAEIEEEVEIIEPEIIITEDYVQQSPLVFQETEVLMWPIDGNVIIPYSMDQTVYFSTLDQYKYSSAVVISGVVGQEVWAVTDGEVTAIAEDSQVGTTVRVNLGDGYEAIYGQIGEVYVKEGDRLEKGFLIGYLGEPTKYYNVEGCNLFFQLLKDGEPINPLHYLDV